MKRNRKMSKKLTNIIFVFTALTVAHHLYAGFGNPWDPRRDDKQGVANEDNKNGVKEEDQTSTPDQKPEELE